MKQATGIKEAETLIETTSIKSTWLGREARTYDFLHNINRTGKRIIVMLWDGPAETEIRAVNGDGRNVNFHSFEELTFNGHLSKDLIKEIAVKLASKYF